MYYTTFLLWMIVTPITLERHLFTFEKDDKGDKFIAWVLAILFSISFYIVLCLFFEIVKRSWLEITTCIL